MPDNFSTNCAIIKPNQKHKKHHIFNKKTKQFDCREKKGFKLKI